jgi:succinate dehydrogenase hydrophobic anchor subunit
MLVRFHSDPDPSLAQLMLALAIWCYHYAQIGASVMIAATTIAAWRTRVLPIWMVPVGVAAVVLGLLHTWIGLTSAVAGLGGSASLACCSWAG